jgi:hypothetical protein
VPYCKEQSQEQCSESQPGSASLETTFRYLGIPNTRQHASRQFRFRLEANRLGNTSSLTPITVLYPVQGQVELAINERMPFGCDIGDYVELTLVILKTAEESSVKAT